MSCNSDKRSANNQNPTYSTRSRSRASLGKRSRGYSFDNSSDGPCFSSDDLSEACIDNYAAPRTKKQHCRTWWEAESKTSVKRVAGTSTTFDKSQDSGVFMASDGSSSSSEDGFGLNQLNERSLKRNAKSHSARDIVFHPTSPASGRKADQIAVQVIQACLEADREEVDLSRCSLVSLSNDAIKPLRNLIRRPNIHEHYLIEEAFQSFNPKLKLFLSSNLLRVIPAEIINLEHLTVLSLRNNKLTELPHSFGRLRNLIELNIAGNRLRWLPWEILSLVRKGKLNNLHVFPNPFLLPYTFTQSSNSHQTIRSSLKEFITAIEDRSEPLKESTNPSKLRERLAWLSIEERSLAAKTSFLQRRQGGRYPVTGTRTEREVTDHRDTGTIEPILLGKTPTCLLTINGTFEGPIGQPPSQTPLEAIVLPLDTSCNSQNPSQDDTSSTISSHVPSLTELALRTCSDQLIFTHIDQDLPVDTPEHISRHLESARCSSEVGQIACSVCEKGHIIPRGEWIEYWHCTDATIPLRLEELWLPFLRRACTWGCANQIISERKSWVNQNRISIDEVSDKVQVAKALLQNNGILS